MSLADILPRGLLPFAGSDAGDDPPAPLDPGRAGDPLLAVRDLRTYYPVRGGALGRRVGDLRAVDGVSFDLYPGETLAVVGESGSGKTTLAETVLGLCDPTAGTVHLDGRPVHRLSGRALRDLRRDVGVVFQDPESSLNGRMTVGRIVREPMVVHGLPGVAEDPRVEIHSEVTEAPAGRNVDLSVTVGQLDVPALDDPDEAVELTVEAAVSGAGDGTGGVEAVVAVDGGAHATVRDDDVAVSTSVGPGGDVDVSVRVSVERTRGQLRRERVRDLLADVGLDPDEHAGRYPHELSGGQRQRVAIARALALSPSLLVADEPTSALDASVQASILQLLDRLQSAYDLTYLLVSHDLSVVRGVADRVAVMYLGRFVETAGVDALFDDPAHPYTGALLSDVPRFRGETDRRVTLRGSPPDPADPPAGCPFHPRCPLKPDLDPDEEARCESERPELAGEGHPAACHFRPE